MSDRAGGLLVWVLFLAGTWYCARPLLIFLAAVLILGAVLVGVVRKLEEQGKGISKSWSKEKENRNV